MIKLRKAFNRKDLRDLNFVELVLGVVTEKLVENVVA